MANHADVIIVGTGGVGSAAAFHLARRGVKVLGLDRFPGGHDRGSSHGHTRIIRLAYFEHPDYVPLLRRAYALWAELEQRRNDRLYFPVGLLEVGSPSGPTIQGILNSARQHNLQVERLDPVECRRRFPGFVVPDDFAAIFESQAGYLLVERCVLAHLDEARKLGANLIHDESVRGWSTTPHGVTVETDQTTYHADRLILTAGPWAGSLLKTATPDLRVRRKHVHWYAAPSNIYQADQGCPTFYYETGVGDFYGFPNVENRGVKVGEHSGGTIVTDPLTDDRTVEPQDRRRVEEFLGRYLPGVERTVRDHVVCYYTMSPDEHFWVDVHPNEPRVAFAAGLSGHGFKFTSVLGEALADLSLTGKTDLPITFLSVNRFSRCVPEMSQAPAAELLRSTLGTKT